MKILLSTLLILTVAFWAQGQNKTVTLKGTLTANNGDAIPWCNAIINGEATSVNTGLCGEFEINISEKFEGTLVFSCMAFRTWEIPNQEIQRQRKNNHFSNRLRQL
jgi:TonB-dependent starch-binding outer membrane protein SusC